MVDPSLQPIDVHVVTDPIEAKAVARFTAVEFWGIEEPSDKDVSDILSEANQLGETRVAAFDEEGKVLAAAGLVRVTLGGEKSGFLMDLATISGKRHRGLGSNVVRYVERLAKENDIKTLEISGVTPVAVTFYEKLGYQRGSSEADFRKRLLA
jgi:predicted N-acetyltransferase YhbS